MADRLSVEVDDLQVMISWKQMRNIRLKVLPPHGEVAVSAPRGVPARQIAQFVREQRAWIDRQRARLKSVSLEQDRLEDGGAARLWGRWHAVEHHHGARARAWVAGDRLLLTGSNDLAREKAIARFRRQEVARVARPLLSSWAAALGVPQPAVIRYRAMRSRWGSCNQRTRSITLNTALARFPAAALEYVIVHELAHLRHAHHGQDFWALVAAALPDHAERKKLLSGHAAS